ncbi:sulfatase [Lignipirellula cremea]|uniref:Choline-sulfatase n=1 Tax=Lignipirellula cremea TaxID=2528010 RepID=A0A518DZA3_9BACT|nr:sulfatase [Lignipirellula cremea]QDU97145.1 Choline-sulfatase [Lignipirellula cremea]
MKRLPLAVLIALTFSLPAAAAEAADRPNVLFIAIDDMNHWVGHLGRHPQSQTPCIDALASQGVAFSRAYCLAPACNPARAALMSGQRPSSTGCYRNAQNWRPGIDEARLLNSHFARAGYRVYGAGKIYHGAGDRGGEWDDYFPGKAETQRHPDAKNDGVGGIRFYPLANSDEEMPDYQVVSYGIKKLQEKSDKPFFLAIGLVKPHMPFSVPKKWFDRFPLESIQLPPHRADDLLDLPPAGRRMAGAEGDHAQMVASGRWKEAVQAYLATIAFADAQVGRLLDGLEKSPHRDNTIVCLWSDHGWSLGEKSHWRKFALWEEPTRTVLVWKAPGVTSPGGLCGRTVDHSSIYPTLCELAGLPLPEHLDGVSAVPLLKDPQAAWSTPAVTTFGFQNHTVRSEGWRYIRYEDGGEELYDETADPLEYVNLAERPEHAARKAELARWLPASNAENLPFAAGKEPKKRKK